LAYDLSFTALSLGAKELSIAAKILLETDSLEQTKNRLIEENLLQKKSLSTNKRIVSEVIKRVANLTKDELATMAESDFSTQRTIALVSALKSYGFIYDFCVEVLRRKYLLFDTELYESDWEQFVDSKKIIDHKLQSATENTINKLKQVTYLMLCEAGVLSDKKPRYIYSPILPTFVAQIIYDDNPSILKGFCMSDTDINSYKREQK